MNIERLDIYNTATSLGRGADLIQTFVERGTWHTATLSVAALQASSVFTVE